jgi:anaerobic dimethyl sulfoxide reductase subunit C (anchor subunit)
MEYSLVLFTTLSQFGTALAVVAALGALSKAAAHDSIQRRFVRIAGILCFPFTALAGLASVFHLGDPWGAMRAFSHAETSWLSREVWAAALFGLAALICSFMWWADRPKTHKQVWSGIAAIMGLATVVASSHVYQLPAHPTWDNGFTPLTFLTTTLLFVPVSAMAILSCNKMDADGIEEWETLTNWAAWGLIGTAILQLALIAAQTSYILGAGGAGLNRYLLSDMGGIYWARIFLSVVLPIAFGGLILRRNDPHGAYVRIAAFSILALVLAGELGGRVLFFSSVLMMPRF